MDETTVKNGNKTLACAFEICDNDRKLQPPPSRFLKRQERHVQNKEKYSKEYLERKQEEATKRRQDHEEAMIARIQERSEECRKIDEKVQVLMEQDALRRQLPGCENIKPLSRSEVSKTIKSVTKDFQNISININKSTDIS
ncbi:hypothetical protein SNE40_002304 [Patella caerulea]|uniref:Uncharacterized protein n=1 Tax=Patella caerulea TaxID=87958 RepID=A0AAN8K0V6_PATCE